MVRRSAADTTHVGERIARRGNVKPAEGTPASAGLLQLQPKEGRRRGRRDRRRDHATIGRVGSTDGSPGCRGTKTGGGLQLEGGDAYGPGQRDVRRGAGKSAGVLATASPLSRQSGDQLSDFVRDN